jgi:hypothetical protein
MRAINSRIRSPEFKNRPSREGKEGILFQPAGVPKEESHSKGIEERAFQKERTSL